MSTSQPWPLAAQSTTPTDEFTSGSGRFSLLIEYSSGGGQYTWWFTDRQPVGAGNRDEARAAALDCAQNYHPIPARQQRGRQVFLVTPDQYLVEIQLRRKLFHFKVSVIEEVTP